MAMEAARALEEDGNTVWTGGSRLDSGDATGALAFFQKGNRQAPVILRHRQGHRLARGGHRGMYEQVTRSIRTESSSRGGLLHRQPTGDLRRRGSSNHDGHSSPNLKTADGAGLHDSHRLTGSNEKSRDRLPRIWTGYGHRDHRPGIEAIRTGKYPDR